MTSDVLLASTNGKNLKLTKMKESDLAKKLSMVSPMEEEVHKVRSNLVEIKRHLEAFEKKVDGEVERFYPVKTVPASPLDSLPTNQ